MTPSELLKMFKINIYILIKKMATPMWQFYVAEQKIEIANKLRSERERNENKRR